MRQYIPYTEKVAIAPSSHPPYKCYQCRITLRDDNTSGQLCDVCWSMLEAVANSYWHDLQVEYWHSIDQMKADKARLMASDGGDSDEPDSKEA